MTMLAWAVAAQPFFPKYPFRNVAVLDGDAWSFGFDASFGDVLRPLDVAAVATPERVLVPSAFDVAEPGVLGRRGEVKEPTWPQLGGYKNEEKLKKYKGGFVGWETHEPGKITELQHRISEPAGSGDGFRTSWEWGRFQN